MKTLISLLNILISDEKPSREMLRAAASASPDIEYPKCRHCGSDKGYWFSRVVPMGNFCESCGGPWTEMDGAD